jgi:hypothetical protein
MDGLLPDRTLGFYYEVNVAGGGQPGTQFRIKRGNMHIKQLPTLEQIKTLQEVRERFMVITKEINIMRKEYANEGDEMPALDTIIKTLKLKYADEKLAEEIAKVNP